MLVLAGVGGGVGWLLVAAGGCAGRTEECWLDCGLGLLLLRPTFTLLCTASETQQHVETLHYTCPTGRLRNFV